MPPTIAITGATGFIGGALVNRLASTRLRIRALVRPASIDKRQNHGELEWVTGDLDDTKSLRRLVDGVDAVVHCAGAVRGITRRDFDDVNVDGVARLVQAAVAQHTPPRFLLLSSLAAREPHLSHYAASKRKGESELYDGVQMHWTIFRPPAVYGPGDREILPLFQWMDRGIAPLTGAADGRISLLYVADLAEAILAWLQCKTDLRRIYELHDGHAGGYSWQDIVDTAERLAGRSIVRLKIPVACVKLAASLNQAAARILGKSPMLTPGKVNELTHPDWVADNGPFTRDSSWVPHILLEEGLTRTIYNSKHPKEKKYHAD